MGPDYPTHDPMIKAIRAEGMNNSQVVDLALTSPTSSDPHDRHPFLYKGRRMGRLDGLLIGFREIRRRWLSAARSRTWRSGGS